MKISKLLDEPRESYLCLENSLLGHVKNRLQGRTQFLSIPRLIETSKHLKIEDLNILDDFFFHLDV
jgi:hypothetical protein